MLTQCCVNNVSHSFSIRGSPCYNSAAAIQFLTVSIYLKSLLSKCCVNNVSYSFSTIRSHCYHSAVAITFLNYQYTHATSPCFYSAVSIRFLSTHRHLEALFHLNAASIRLILQMINCCHITVSKLIIIYFLYLKVIPTTVLPSTHTSPCYHRALSMQFTVTIHLKIFAVRVNMVSYFFCTQKFLLPQCRGNVKYIQVTATIDLCQKCFIVSVQSQICASHGHFQVMSTSKFICQ